MRAQPGKVEGFRACFTESPDPQMNPHVAHTLFYRRSIVDLAAFFGCEATEAAVMAARSRMAFEDLVRRSFTDANIHTALVDYGYRRRDHYSPVDLARLLPCRTFPVLRLEVLLEDLIPAARSVADLEEAFVAAVDAAPQQGVVAYKTIIAYRCGLAIERHAQAAVEAAFQAERKRIRDGKVRLEAKPLLDTLLWRALERITRLRLPLQVHTGFGDSDLHLVYANPAWLRPVLEEPAFRSIRFVLLHCFPYVQEAAWLSGVYSHVYMDLSLTIPFVAHGGADAVSQALMHAPVTKVLYASDAFSIPELYWVGALHGRRALAAGLQAIVQQGYLQEAEVEDVAARILGRNARDVYELPN